MLAIFRGLPGTGKSFLVRRLLEARPDMLVLSRDAFRAAIVPCPSFSEPEKELIDDLILEASLFLLRRGRSVVIDGMALSSSRRVDGFVAAAAAAGTPCRIVECVCSQETALSRISHDAGSHPAADRGEKLYFEVRSRFEPLSHACLRVDTDGNPDENIREIIRYLDSP